MRVLIVAPMSDLATLAELLAAVGENVPTILSGTVPAREVINQVQSGKYDIIHFAGHGESMELQLSDGALSAEMLASVINEQSAPKLMFFNSCASLPIAALLHGYGVAYTIGWRQEDVYDKPASQFAVTFYASLRFNGCDIRRAFDAASDAILRHHNEIELPILINGRMAALLQEVTEMKERMAIQTGEMRSRMDWFWRVVTVTALVTALLSVFK